MRPTPPDQLPPLAQRVVDDVMEHIFPAPADRMSEAACVPCSWWWPVECDDHGAVRIGDLLCPRCGRLGGFRSAERLVELELEAAA